MMSGEAQLMLVVMAMHLLGLVGAAALLIPALRSVEEPPDVDGGSDGGGSKKRPPAPSRPDRPGPGLPLPDAIPARVRLRNHERLADLLPRRERRPAREPDRRPVRTPS